MLTDLQGSPQAWEKQPKAMRSTMARHDAILASAVRNHKGELVEAGREVDSVLAVFRTAATAAECALDIQKNFAAESWPEDLDLKVRVALHTGEAQLREGHYFGGTLNRCARLMATCHPGQILLTKATEAMLVDELPPNAALEDLGLHRFKDVARPEQVFQLSDLNRPTEFPPIQSLLQRQTNMPTYLTTFVGRDSELAELRSLHTKSRMVTLTGPGGSGKTRLAAELGRACLDFWPGGVWWVELEPVNDPRQVPGAVVAALKLPGRGPALDVAAAWLSPRQAVLVLDNCEHLVAACAEFCQAVLQRCPELKLIATSRETLGVPGEAHWPVSSLRASDAVQLFEARASLVRPDFKVTATNLEAVTQICEHLDGMPLAIELAAARVRVMTEREILTQLSDRFRLLTGGGRTVPERQQTMIATIDWSYRLLTDDEALLFRRLAVFRDGFTLESVQGVCGEALAGDVLDILAGLVQKSIVVAERTEDLGSRYRLLESLLAYAEDRLRETGEIELMRRRHYEYFQESLTAKTLAFVGLRRVSPGLAEAEWKIREWSNLWAALGWARDNADDSGLSLAIDLSRATIEVRPADLVRLRRLLVELLDLSSAKGPLRLKALLSVARSAYLLGDYE
jgi:predicted ATPase/class 3 adenylate cyclase